MVNLSCIVSYIYDIPHGQISPFQDTGEDTRSWVAYLRGSPFSGGSAGKTVVKSQLKKRFRSVNISQHKFAADAPFKIASWNCRGLTLPKFEWLTERMSNVRTPDGYDVLCL